MKTPWTDSVDTNAPLPEYPRPQLERGNWTNLNGQWDYAIVEREAAKPETYEGKILVPFAVESALSGVERRVGPGHRLWYRRTFAAPAKADGERVKLHFGAVDWEAEVYLNGHALGVHRGGFDPFSFDITRLLVEGEQELIVAVWDPSDAGAQPRGKQVNNPSGIWYTPVTGIWQTVWLEVLPAASIKGLRIVPDYDTGSLSFAVDLDGPRGDAKLNVRILADGETVVETDITEFDCVVDYSTPTQIKIPHFRAWSPEDPFLYDVELTYTASGFTDNVKTYAAIRKVEVRRAGNGRDRIFVNNKPIFPYGPLDQGWWPDGLYTAPTDEALRWDLEITKAMGFNMTRKHVKVEPARWYYHCDKIGLLVWQDMPSAIRSGEPGHVPPRLQPIDGVFNAEDAAQWRAELFAMIDALEHFPCITAWIPFNECWGQHNTNITLAAVKQRDPSRLTNGPSGWNDLGYGDTFDQHIYPGPGMWNPQPGRASVLGEFGGLSAAAEGHLWQNDGNWGYRGVEELADMELHYTSLAKQVRPLIPQGLSAAVYTQFTDVEGEINGFVTYDRQIIKIPVEKLKAVHDELTSAL
jgi:beta-galactosidase/beta-glucuronidase